MRQNPLGLILAGLLALPAAAAGSSPAPTLVRLDQALTYTLQKKAQGLLAPDRYAEFAAKFRVDLAAADASVPSTPMNTDLHARILARLSELDQAADRAASAPRRADSRSALSRVHFEKKTTPAVIAEERAVLASEPFNGDRAAQSVVETGVAMRKSHPAVIDKALPYKPSIQVAPAVAPPELAVGDVPTAPKPLPLVPLAEAAALGLAAFEISRSRATYSSDEGLDEAHLKPVGRYQRLVAGTILAGAAGGAIYLAGAAALTVSAPVLLRYAEPVVSQGLRLAGSEAGAINPGSLEKAEQAVPQTEAAAADAEQIILKKGETLNRVWHSEWETNPAASGPTGQSYCRGNCLPIHAADAIERRGLNIEGVVNNARRGGIYSVKEDIVAVVRKAINGSEEEIVLHPSDVNKLNEVSRSHLPPGTK